MEVLSERVSTGVPRLDTMLGGGFIRGRTYLVTGETGVGKTILSLQFILNGLQLGEYCVYVSIDERIEGVLRGAESLGWDFWSYMQTGQFIPLELRIYSSDIRKYGKDSRAFVDAIYRAMRGRPVTRLVLDPVSALAQGAKDEFFVREYLREIITTIEEKFRVTTLMTTDIPTGSNTLSRFALEEFLASGVVVLKVNKLLGRLVRTIYVRKMRWSSMDSTEYVFTIEPGRGIVIREPYEVYLNRVASKGPKLVDDPSKQAKEPDET
ncbi:MAG TPA: recombinase RecA [Candidatus Caldiarchaeum subterraneum]|uniref:Recombinase RecA n=1 Tax=Caldiarchaeum subterraneum TaxID=311458 RepID=A0A832ZU02_CALS0|nr:recombinase RecA [Candidatus Caldarchaeum subterraneum]